jgi:hypothetical protein
MVYVQEVHVHLLWQYNFEYTPLHEVVLAQEYRIHKIYPDDPMGMDIVVAFDQATTLQVELV